jgi:hypothetical protein
MTQIDILKSVSGNYNPSGHSSLIEILIVVVVVVVVVEVVFLTQTSTLVKGTVEEHTPVLDGY